MTTRRRPHAPRSSSSLSTRVRRHIGCGVVAGCAVVAGCGSGGGGGGGGLATGTFIDSPVAGLGYSGGERIDTTDAAGRFSVTPGVTMTFFIGDIVLGVAPFAREITPISIVTNATDETNESVTNIVRLLLALDQDADPDNGIQLSDAVRQAAVGLTLNFNQSSANFSAAPAVQTLLGVVGAAGLVSDAEAQAHLRTTLFGVRGGLYSGSYTGDDNGPFLAFLDRRGQLVGYAFSQEDQELFGFTGSVGTDGRGVFGNTTTGSTFQGPVGGGQLSGTWSSSIFQTSGTYAGDQDDGLVPTLETAETAPFVGTWSGVATLAGESMNFSAVVFADGHVAVTLADGTEIAAAVDSVAATGAAVLGLTEEGTVVRATLSDAGSLTGTLQNNQLGQNGTITGTKQ